MKHTGILTLTGLLALALPTLSAETKQLPAPDIKGGIPLMQAIDQRHSERRACHPERSRMFLGHFYCSTSLRRSTKPLSSEFCFSALAL